MSRARRKKEGLTRLLARPECVARSRPSARPGETRARALFAATCLLVTAGAQPARAADELDLRPPRFERLPGNHELPDKRVTAIAADREGFLWLATFSGLFRYDGYSFRRFRHDPADPGTLSADRLRSLLADGEGALWVGTWNVGLNRFDPRTGRATRFRSDPSDPGSLSGDQVRTIFEDRRGRLWVGTTQGLNRLDRRTGRFVRYQHDPDDPGSLADDSVTGLAEGPDGSLWVGTAAGGLHQLREGETTFQRFRHDPSDPASLGDDRIQALAVESTGRIWIASWGGGLAALDPSSGRFTHYRHDPADPGSIPDDELFDVWLGPNGQVWVIALAGELARLDPRTGRAQRFPHDPGRVGRPPRSLSGAVHKDSAGSLWLGTHGDGVWVWHRSKPAVSHFRHVEGLAGTLSDDYVLAVAQTSDGALWAGTRSGLDRLDEASGTFTTFRHDPGDPASLGSDFVMSLLEGSNGALWVGTWGSGLNRLDPRSGGFTRYPCGPGSPGGMADCDVRALFEDSRGRLWVGSFTGLYRLDPGSRLFARYVHDADDPTSLSNPIVQSIAEDDSGALWIGTDKGLNRLHPRSGRFDRFRHDPEGAGELIHHDVEVIQKARDGSLWLGTGVGVQRLSWDASGAPRFERFAEGLLPRLHVGGIVLDRGGGVWVTSESAGLWRVDPAAREARGFGPPAGVTQGSEGAAVRMRDGRLAIGTFNGLVLFDPTSVTPQEHAPPVVITSIAVNNEPLSTRPDSASRSLLAPRSLALTPRDEVVSFEFAALDFQAPQMNRYRYRLEGFDEDWVEADASHRIATYTQLRPGQYVFRVMGSDYAGLWNEEGTSVVLTVLPAWWQTTWFRLVATLSLVTFLVMLHRLRIKYVVEKNRQLNEIQERMRLATSSAEVSLWEWDVPRDEFWGTELMRRRYHIDQFEHLTLDRFLRAIHPDDRDGARRTVREALEGTGTLEMEYRVVAPSGEARWIAVRGEVERDQGGMALRVRGASYDITDRKVAEMKLHSLSGKLVMTQEEERRRVARELHDGVNQRLAMLSLRLGVLAKRPPEGPEATSRELEELKTTALGLSREVRDVSHRLHSSELEHLGLVQALRTECSRVEKESGMKIDLDTEAAPDSSPLDPALCLYRVAQESFANAVKHSGASRIRVRLGALDGGIELTVSDDGAGFDPGATRGGGGLGLASMEERVRYARGRFQLTSHPGTGTEVRVWIPIETTVTKEPSDEDAGSSGGRSLAGPRRS